MSTGQTFRFMCGSLSEDLPIPRYPVFAGVGKNLGLRQTLTLTLTLIYASSEKSKWCVRSASLQRL